MTELAPMSKIGGGRSADTNSPSTTRNTKTIQNTRTQNRPPEHAEGATTALEG